MAEAEARVGSGILQPEQMRMSSDRHLLSFGVLLTAGHESPLLLGVSGTLPLWTLSHWPLLLLVSVFLLAVRVGGLSVGWNLMPLLLIPWFHNPQLFQTTLCPL